LSFGAYNNTSGAGGNPYFGAIDEFAFYAAKLDSAQILAHYQNGTNASRTTPYDALIKSASPAFYLRLNELSPGPDLALNMGDLFATANAPYTSVVKHPGTSSRAALKSGNIACDISDDQIDTPTHVFLERGTGTVTRLALAARPSPILSLDGSP
jgi:hypothetical protein